MKRRRILLQMVVLLKREKRQVHCTVIAIAAQGDEEGVWSLYVPIAELHPGLSYNSKYDE